MGRMKSLGYAYAEYLQEEITSEDSDELQGQMDVDQYFEDIIHGEVEIPKWFVEQWLVANPIFASEEFSAEEDYEVIMVNVNHSMERDGETFVFGDVMFGLPDNGRSRISSYGQGPDKPSARQSLIERAIEHLHRDERMSAENEYQPINMDNFKNCGDTGWRIYGRKLYYNCNQIGTLVKNSGRYADKHDPINNMYVGNLKLRGTNISWFEPAQELSLISHQLKPESYSDWAEVAKLTNDTVGIWSAEEVENFNVEFNDWANQEMMTHGKAVSFKEWAKEEGESHGDMDLTDWAKDEEKSHDERYDAETKSWRIQNRDSSGKFTKGFVEEIDIANFMEMEPESIPEISVETTYTTEQTVDFVNAMINDDDLPMRLMDSSFVNALQSHISSADVEMLQSLNDAANMAAFEALMGGSVDNQQAASRAVFVTDMLMNYKWGQDYWASEWE